MGSIFPFQPFFRTWDKFTHVFIFSPEQDIAWGQFLKNAADQLQLYNAAIRHMCMARNKLPVSAATGT